MKFGRIHYLMVVLAALLIVVGYSGCESKFDVNAEWKDITVVYGLLNQNESQHFIKINKAFLGPADAYEMALISDSSEYANLSGVVEQWRDGFFIKSHVLKDSTITNKESGTFYAPVQKVYYFNEPDLDPDSKYKLKIFFENGSKSDTVSAETEIIDDGQLSVKFPPPTIDFSFATGSDYIDRDFKWQSAKDGKRYQISFLFDYYEIGANGDSALKTLKWAFPVQKTVDALGGDELKILMTGEDFYLLFMNLDPIDENIVKRVPDTTWISNKVGVPLRYEISVAGEELSTYIDINSPSTGIVQEKPQYTNVKNGLGIFSARYKLKGVRFIDPSSIRELVDGSIGGYTTELGFCNPYLPDTDPKSCYYIP